MNKNKLRKIAGRLSVGFVTLAGLVFAVQAGAQNLELSVDQPAYSRSVDDGSDGRAKPAPAPGHTAVYIVRLSDPAMARYEGGIAGMAATSIRVTGGRFLDATRPAAVAYEQFLCDKQSAFVAECETALGHSLDVRFKYQHALNGVAMVLTFLRT